MAFSPMSVLMVMVELTVKSLVVSDAKEIPETVNVLADIVLKEALVAVRVVIPAVLAVMVLVVMVLA